jgi:DNA-nicking Smr family endonuclease
MKRSEGPNFEDLLDEYSSEEDIKSALKEKQEGDIKQPKNVGEKIKTYPEPQRRLDLHLLTSDQARRAIVGFIYECTQQHLLTVRIITGIGLHSKGGGPVLLGLTEQILTEMKKNRRVLDFKRAKDGGSFIVYI